MSATARTALTPRALRAHFDLPYLTAERSDTMPAGPGLDIGAVVFTALLAAFLAAEIGRALVARWVLRWRVPGATKTGDSEG